MKHADGRFYGPAGRIDCAGLKCCTAQISRYQTHPAIGAERRRWWTQHSVIGSDGWRIAPEKPVILQHWLTPIIGQIIACDGHDIAVQQAGMYQLPNDITHAARRVEMVHITRSIWINPRNERHSRGQLVQIFPVDYNPSRPRDCRNMQRMVG